MKLKNLMGAFLALAGMAFLLPAAAETGDIYSIHPLDADGQINPPTVPYLQGGDTARFVVRLQTPEGKNPFRLVHVGSGSEASDWESRRPKIGIFVSGEFRLAALESWAETFDHNFTDFIFSYTVKPGDFELPIRLADSNRKMVTNSGAESTKYYLDFVCDTAYAPAWTVDNSTELALADKTAVFQYSIYSPYTPTDGSQDYHQNYDFTACRFAVKTVDFDDNDESEIYWRTVHQGSTQTGGADPTLHVEGVPTNTATFYVWSMNESAVKVVGATKVIHVAADQPENRQVATIKIIAGVQDYPFQVEGVTQGQVAELVMSATPDFNYDGGFAEKPRIEDYMKVLVNCTAPLPASVKVQPTASYVTATSTSWKQKVTEINVSFSEPFGEDVRIEIVPDFGKEGAPLPWGDYIRFSNRADEDVTLQKAPIANPVVVIRAGETKPSAFTNGTAIVDGKIYVYALRSDDWSNGSESTLTFGVRTDNANASKPSTEGGIDGWMNPPQSNPPQSTLQVLAQDPAILQPAEGDASTKTYAGSDCTFKIAVSDDYADMTNAFKVSIWKNTDDAGDNWQDLAEDFYPDKRTGVLYTKDGQLPKVKYSTLGANKTSIKVKSALSMNESEPRNIVVTVVAAKGYTVSTVDEIYEFDEGTATQVKIVFDDIVQDDCYAYLKGYSAADTNVLTCSWIAGPGGVGELIKAGATELSGLSLQIDDGDESKLGSKFKYEVVLLTTPTWSDNDEDRYTKFKSLNVLQFTTHNVKPTVTSVTPDNKVAKKVKNGGTISGVFPMSDTVKHTFKLAVEEPGEYDKTIGTEGKRFQTSWVFFNESEGDSDHYPDEAPEDGLVYGNPDTNTCTIAFSEAGHYRVEVRLKDKDMPDFDDERVFTFYLDVIDQPTVTVEAEAGGYREQNIPEFGGNSKMDLVLSLNECNFDIFVNVRITPNNESDNPGLLELVTNTTGVVAQPDGSYIVKVAKKQTRVPLWIARMDGTRDSAMTGFAVELTIPEELNNSNKVPNAPPERAYPYQYYNPVGPDPVKVLNDNPIVNEAIDLDPVPSTNIYPVAAGLWEQTIHWSFNDVTHDFDRPVQGGVTVSITGGGGKFETNCTSYADAMASGLTGFTPNFSGKSGRQTVTLTIKDHDGGVAGPFSWEFEVADAKGMSLVAHGPATGSGAALSKRYRTAAGIGEGRVWAKSDSDIPVVSFESTVNCGMASSWRVYGYGYKVDDKDDGVNLHWPDGFGGYTLGYYTAHDTPIKPDGSNLGVSTEAYAYHAPKDDNGNPCDSFLYTWLQLVTNDKESSGSQSATTDSYLNNATAPEYTGTAANHVTDSGSPITLPTEKAKDGTGYSQTFIEAVFSRELFASDNMGDINQDGIPDIYVDKYGMGVVDTTTGQVSGDDLAKLGGFNEDEDYLPSADIASYSALIPGLASSWITGGKPFTARLEIRGYGDALNDAPDNNALTRVSGVVPDRIYLNPAEDRTSTLEPVEYLAWCEWAAANGLDPDDKANWTKWSPERPTDPTKADTDDDGYPDGYEYYFWYRAHVGYFDANGVHRYLTGRAYDPRNPGEGRFIDSKTIESLMDPVIAADSESAETRDTDNDGLPDLLEFELGTNPFDFDTDGDGLPDGWEICNVGNLDPLDPASHLDGKSDTVRNSDGDAMAISSYALEKTQKPVPAEIEHAKRTTFAVIDPSGDTDGVQWYAVKGAPADVAVEAVTNAASVWSFESEGRTFISTEKPVLTVDGRLGKTLAKDVTFVSVKPEPVWTNGVIGQVEEPEGSGTMVDVEGPITNYVAAALYPVRLAAGAPIRMLFDEAIDGVVTTLAADIAEKDANACWIYGKGPQNALYGEVAATAADYGCLALGRYKGVKAGAVVCALPDDTRDVAFLHYLVYQEFGFDPRTAWKAKDPLATRWSKSIDGQAVEGITQIQQGGYTGAPARTRDYANYDEFLVYSFFVNNGCDMSGKTRITDKEATPLVVIWDMFTTNPQGPNEKTVAAESGGTSGETTVTVKSYGRGENGADTDFDGVPDGWELYVMAGPKTTQGDYVFAPPYAGFDNAFTLPFREPGSTYSPYYLKESYFSPFLDFAKGTETSNQIYLGGQQNDDTLNEFHEFEGTDSIAYYAVAEKAGDQPFSTTVVHPADESWTWFNKFFPTDPWNVDTDGDSVKDNEEKGAFAYGKPADDGKLWSIPGGGLNPCSIDTDLDGIPDPWELQYKPANYANIYAGDNPKPFYAKDADGNEIGNPLEGLTDGMDGTVPDAYNVVNGSSGSAAGQTTWTVITPDGRRWSGHVNRDYDRDGLENWQEYLTGTMRCWRYDDPYSPWTAIPKEMYYTYDAKNAKWAWDPKYEKLGCNKDNPDEFWYKTLVDRESGIYNPHLVVDTVCGQYFSKVTNAWDAAYLDSTLSAGKKDGAWYFLYDRIGPDLIKDIWVGTILDQKRLFGLTKTTAPTKYMGCSPLEYDSDKDGMDDYYELFHGLNPILGESGKNLASEGPCDLVFDAWRGGETGVDGQFEAWGDSTTANWWQRNPKKGLPNGGKSRSLVPGGYDFEVYPWLNGLQMADPDGDDMRNVYEAVMPRFADDAWHHTDPTPLWMTDTSYADSIVRRFFCLPTRFDEVSTANESFFGSDGAEYFFRDMSAGWVADPSGNVFLPFVPDFWDLSTSGAYNWICSFEENEGYDTDHDGTGDTEEASSRTRAATDPQDFDSPRRRQAMYFAGAEWPSVLQTMPEETERYPVATQAYPDDASFRQYTVECWVKPDAPEGAEFPDMTILERAIWTGLSNPGDEEFMRKNFQLGIKKNKWYTKYDPDGTLKDTVVEVFSTGDASTGWHHLAATYDGVQLVLYVDGMAQTPMKSSLAPERGMSALALRRNWSDGLQPGDYWFDREYAYKAFIIGARAKGRTELPAAVRETGYTTLDLAHGVDFSRYDGFFKGYVDEISVWDGARSFDDIYADYSQRIRLDRTAAIANRSEFYKKWSVGGRRYAADLSGTSSSLVPELRYHWSFDALFGAENPGQVAIEPHGFSAAGKPILSRPKDYVVSWWSQVVGNSDSVYAGNLDWVPWIHNTVAHLPRFDTTTLDSMFWSENFCGATNGTYAFPRTAEPVSRWTQFAYNGVNRSSRYQTAASRHHLVYEQGWSPSNTTTLVTQFEFTGRHLNQIGDDLLPLGGAFVKYVDTMWDDQGASSMWEQTGEDSTANGLPDWWEEYADQNYRPKGMAPGSEIDWNTELVRDGIGMTAGEAYLRDLAAGMYVDADGAVHPTESDRAAGILKTPFEQTAKSDGLIPDWWKSLYKIDGEGPLVDNDNDGLNNYVEYMASELLPFGFRLNPLMPRTDTVTLDYFRKVGKLYVGEMLTDHDQMEDHWERSLANAAIADPTLWDALKDVDGDGWNNFAENRYNGYRMSTLAQLASHAVGDAEELDAPIPSVTLTVRYNGSNLGGAAKDAAGGGKSGENADNKEASKLPNLVVRAYTKTGGKPDAEYVLAPGQTVDREVYIGGWEDRVVRGTMSPGNIDLGSVNIKFAQIPQADIYSWTDENGRHLAGTYAEFKEAFDRNPDIIQNIQDFTWLELVAPVNQYTSSDRAVTVSREKLTQTGYIAVYGERVGTVDLTTGEFEFDLTAMNNLRVNYTYDGGKGPEAAWSYKEAIFKITYSATVPAVQADRFQVTLAKADTGFMKGGKNSFTAFFDNDGNGEYTPGEPFGVLNDVEIGWSGRTLELELTDMSAVTPRVDLWTADTDRAALTADDGQTNISFVAVASAPARQCRVSVVRHRFNEDSPYDCGIVDNAVVYEGDFTSDARTFLHEGDFLASGPDIDWDHLYADAVADEGTYRQIGALTNVTYLVVFDGQFGADPQGKDTKALSEVITRRFEVRRRKPTPCLERMVFNRARPTFAWTIEGEDPWAAKFGTTYTAFKVRVRTLSGDLVYESDVTRMPAKDSDGVYTWTAPLYVGARTAQGVVFENLTDYTWEIALYNAKFSTDSVMSSDVNGVVNGNPFSGKQTFRMNVTHQDLSSCSIAVAVSYAGPATKLANRIRVQAFESPDFTGDPVAEKTVGSADQVVVLDGLAEGDYFIRAYIDTNGNGVHDEWESWGYLCERDLANKADIFNPVIARSRFNADEKNVRMVHIEDCDTDGDWFPDVWEAEQNGGVFEAFKSGKGQGPVTGNAELIGVNTNLDANLTKAMQGIGQMTRALKSVSGVSLMTGLAPQNIAMTANGFEVESEVKSDTLTIIGFTVDAANGRVLLTVGADTTANIDPTVANFLNITVRKGAEVTVRVEYAESPAGPWTELEGVGGKVTVDHAGADIEAKLEGELPAQGYFRAKIEEEQR